MATSKNAVLFQLFAITRAPIGEGLDQKVSDSIATEVDKFSAGRKTKTTGPNLEILLAAVTDVVGTVEVAARVARRTAIDSLTRAEKDARDYVKEFGKENVRAWLLERGAESLAKKVSAKSLNAMVVKIKEETWEDEPGQETAAIDQADLDKAAADKARKEQEAAAAKANATAGASSSKSAPSKALTITEPQAIFVVSNGKTMTGFLNVDATVSFDKSDNGNVSGKTFSSTSKAACAAMGVKAANGWLRIQFMDGETKKPIDALRANSKGYSLGTGRRKKMVGVAACQEAITKLETRETYLDDALVKTKARLEQAKADLAEAKTVESNATSATDDAKGSSDSTPALPAAPAEASKNGDRSAELKAMKVKALRSLAKDLNVKGRSKLKTAALVDAILAAEAA
ncbi:hypothetical protein LCGC14_1085490 [marine sediment metagenome]|uniref:Rho termination factor-like N-terminal domain-containing protein n=1 Tax=marine sediment metagenome TaxID=412755 RepID=A0A0F9N1J7_9ZZZZ